MQASERRRERESAKRGRRGRIRFGHESSLSAIADPAVRMIEGSDLGSDDEALTPLEVEPAAPPPAAWQRRKSRMEAAGTAKLLEACPSDAICHEAWESSSESVVI